MLDTLFSPELSPKRPEVLPAVGTCRWQTHALTEFTLGALMHENPYLWIDETAPAVADRKFVDASPVAGQAIALAAQDAQIAQSAEEQALAAAHRAVDQALAAEEVDHGLSA